MYETRVVGGREGGETIQYSTIFGMGGRLICFFISNRGQKREARVFHGGGTGEGGGMKHHAW